MTDSLKHYGKKGMKWGVTKGKRTSVRSERKATSKKRRGLSDAELKKRVERLQSEKKLKDLTDADIAPGRSAVKRILSSSGEKAAKTIVSGAILLAVKTAVTKEFNPKDAAGYVAPKPKK